MDDYRFVCAGAHIIYESAGRISRRLFAESGRTVFADPVRMRDERRRISAAGADCKAMEISLVFVSDAGTFGAADCSRRDLDYRDAHHLRQAVSAARDAAYLRRYQSQSADSKAPVAGRQVSGKRNDPFKSGNGRDFKPDCIL